MFGRAAAEKSPHRRIYVCAQITGHVQVIDKATRKKAKKMTCACACVHHLALGHLLAAQLFGLIVIISSSGPAEKSKESRYHREVYYT